MTSLRPSFVAILSAAAVAAVACGSTVGTERATPTTCNNVCVPNDR